MRRGAAFALFVAVVGGLVVAAPAVAQVPEGAPSTTRTLQVWPRSGLVHQQVVRIHGEGWGRRQFLNLYQCTAGSTTADTCELIQWAARSGLQGGFRSQRPVEVVLDTPGGRHDCRLEACALIAAQERRGLLRGARSVDLAFDPTGPDPADPAATVTPSTGLVDRQVVRIDGTGFEQGDEFDTAADVMQCVAPADTEDDCDLSTSWSIKVRPDGRFRFGFKVHTTVETADGDHDCRTGSCVLAVRRTGHFDEAAIVPTSFDPEAPVTEPTMVAFARGDRVDGGILQLRARGLDPDEPLYLLLQCTASPDSFDDCDAAAIQDALLPAADGRDTRQVTTWMTIVTPADGEVDCRVTACSVVAFGEGRALGHYAEAPIEFEPGAEPMETRVTVSPVTGLHQGDSLRIVGTGFHPWEFVEADLCLAGATSWQDCDHQNTSWNWAAGPRRIPPPPGWDGPPSGFTGRFPVVDHVWIDDERIDCRVEACFLVFYRIHGWSGLDDDSYPAFDPYRVVRLRFAPN